MASTGTPLQSSPPVSRSEKAVLVCALGCAANPEGVDLNITSADGEYRRYQLTHNQARLIARVIQLAQFSAKASES